MDRLAKNFPPGLEYTIVYDTTKYVNENIDEVEHTLVEAFVLVLIVVFVFLQGVRATIIPMLAIPVSLVATFAMMAAFGFSINTLTLCGLVLAIGLVVDDAIIVVENVEKFLERGSGRSRRPARPWPRSRRRSSRSRWCWRRCSSPWRSSRGLTGRLYNQFAMTIVFSFLFSAFNSLTFSPAMARLFLRPKHGETRFFPSAGSIAGMHWLENSYDAFLDFTAHHWWTIVVPSLGLLALTGWMLIERPKAFIPTEDQGYLIVAIQTPDGTGREATSRIAQRVGKIAGELEGVQRRRAARRLQRVQLDQPDQLGHGVRHPRGVVGAGPRRSCGPRRWPGSSRAGSPSRSAARVVLVLQPPPIRGLSQTGGFEFMIEDREGKGVEALASGHRPVPRRGPSKRPELAGRLHAVLGPRAPAPLRPRPHQGPAARRRGLRRLQRPPGQPGRPTTSTTSTSTARSGRSSSRPREPTAPARRHRAPYVLNRKGTRCP